MSDHKEDTKPAEATVSEPAADEKQTVKAVEASPKDNDSQAPAELTPGTVVLAKVKGFPAWPGIVSFADLPSIDRWWWWWC